MESRTPTIAWNMPSGVAEKILKNHEKPNLLHAAGGTRQLEIPPSVPLISHMNPFPSMHHAKEKNETGAPLSLDCGKATGHRSSIWITKGGMPE